MDRIERIIELVKRTAELNQNTYAAYNWLQKGQSTLTMEEVKEMVVQYKDYDFQLLYSLIFDDCPDKEMLKRRYEIVKLNLTQYGPIKPIGKEFIDGLLDKKTPCPDELRWAYYHLFKKRNILIRDVSNIIFWKMEEQFGASVCPNPLSDYVDDDNIPHQWGREMSEDSNTKLRISQTKKGRPKEVFKSCITPKYLDKESSIIKKMAFHLRNKRASAVVPIIACMVQLGYIRKPTYAEFKNEFGICITGKDYKKLITDRDLNIIDTTEINYSLMI